MEHTRPLVMTVALLWASSDVRHECHHHVVRSRAFFKELRQDQGGTCITSHQLVPPVDIDGHVLQKGEDHSFILYDV